VGPDLGGGRLFLGHDKWWAAVARSQSGGTCRRGYEFFFLFFFIWVCLGLRCKSCDVGCLELFGFEEDEWVVICSADVDGHMMLTNVCLGFVLKIFFFFGSF